MVDVHTPDLVLVAPSSPCEEAKPAKNRKKSGKKGSRGSPDHVCNLERRQEVVEHKATSGFDQVQDQLRQILNAIAPQR